MAQNHTPTLHQCQFPGFDIVFHNHRERLGEGYKGQRGPLYCPNIYYFCNVMLIQEYFKKKKIYLELRSFTTMTVCRSHSVSQVVHMEFWGKLWCLTFAFFSFFSFLLDFKESSQCASLPTVTASQAESLLHYTGLNGREVCHRQDS